MTFATPIALLGLLAIPALALLMASRSRRRDRFAMRFPAAASLARAANPQEAYWRWLPSAVALAALAALVVAAAHPKHTVRVALQEASIMLVTDHSGSMAANDVTPDRLTAAKNAATSFVDKLPSGVKVGIVAYSAEPDDVEAPSTNHAVTKAAIARQVANGGTATGDALAVALGLLRPKKTTRTPAAIVLLSDGTTTQGSDPVDVARQAKAMNVPVYTVALGSADATVPNPDPFGPPLPAVPDPEGMRQIADASGGRAFTAQDAGRLGSIYQALGSQLGSKPVTRDAVGYPLGAGLLLLIAAGGLAARRRAM
ncbi:VWA domain-containing protein [Paraconexibacter antarcticus]|uniref:VWA domain-containing protein n=1 Tax=Paraconexibacter antarcticus TaxID=2949664 RepID=A0ABY5DVE9_9ACTN|nr:VWA domain-containing protein [Paraconexibacter antarcticus]UTI64904.1 VWA domain-containing protein [Paraconexibacter antarcticus]